MLFCLAYDILKAGNEVVAIKRKYSQEEVETRMRGRFYCNPDDKNLFVRRRAWGAWTMNMGNPWAWCAVGAIALAVCLAAYLLLWVLGV